MAIAPGTIVPAITLKTIHNGVLGPDLTSECMVTNVHSMGQAMI